MKRIIRLEPGHYLHIDSYRSRFLHHLRPKASWTTAVFAITTFSLCMFYGTFTSRLMDNTPAYQSSEASQRRFEPLP
jgi:hypothetical protein